MSLIKLLQLAIELPQQQTPGMIHVEQATPVIARKCDEVSVELIIKNSATV